MSIANKSQIIGFVIGIKNKYLIIFLEENRFGILSKKFFTKKRFFIGQLIIGRFETQVSSSIRYKVTKRLKTHSFTGIYKFNWPYSQTLLRIPKNLIFKVLGLYYFDFFFKKIGKFLEYRSALATNGLITYSAIGNIINNFFIIKLTFSNYVSL